MPMKKPSASGASVLGPLPAIWRGSCLEVFSNLMEFLFSPLWEDGSSRALGTLAVQFSQGKVMVKLKDTELKRYAFFSADTLDSALEAADAALGTGEGDWRKDEWAGKRASGK
jgi:hypothetical protein